jgi:hypothetical protein
MDRATRVRRRVALSGDRQPTFDEIGGPLRNRRSVPAQLIRRRRNFIERRAAQVRVLDRMESALHDRRTNAVRPRAKVFVTRSKKRRSAELFGVEAMRNFLRGILSLRQGSDDGLGGEMIPESGVVLEAAFHSIR